MPLEKERVVVVAVGRAFGEPLYQYEAARRGFSWRVTRCDVYSIIAHLAEGLGTAASSAIEATVDRNAVLRCEGRASLLCGLPRVCLVGVLEKTESIALEQGRRRSLVVERRIPEIQQGSKKTPPVHCRARKSKVRYLPVDVDVGS